jgi:hypothetical protein
MMMAFWKYNWTKQDIDTFPEIWKVKFYTKISGQYSSRSMKRILITAAQDNGEKLKNKAYFCTTMNLKISNIL